MRNIFLIGSILLSIAYKKAKALTPQECLQSLIKANGSDKKFAGSDNTYCAYTSDGSIKEATFNIKGSDLNDWDISVGTWNSQNTFINTRTPTVVKENNKYRVKFENKENNAIVWTLNNGSSGEIKDVKLEESILKKREDKAQVCHAFNTDEQKMIWEDISWDTNVEKSINLSVGEININNTEFLSTLALLFKKENNNGFNNYFDKEFTLKFKIKTDSNRWKVYASHFDEETYDIDGTYVWDLAPNNEESVPNETQKSIAYHKLPRNVDGHKNLDSSNYYNIELKPKDSDYKGTNPVTTYNLFWFVNQGFEINQAKIWIKDLKVEGCENSKDKMESSN